MKIRRLAGILKIPLFKAALRSFVRMTRANWICGNGCMKLFMDIYLLKGYFLARMSFCFFMCWLNRNI